MNSKSEGTSESNLEATEERLSFGRWRWPRDLKGGGGGEIEGIHQILGRMKRTNQDAMLVFEKFDKNITKGGFVPETTTKKGKGYPVGSILLGFFVFVVTRSSLFQIIRTATSGGIA
ncbi:hypothetical protein AALP_AA8G171800 [Arabis alpina]|uniref:Uncharacterized protein n=1 Tax=Arabis alpina TaxID=50452 RepID=A0A087G7K9_ARAAL|nr:hypothetical protein AALP_AA8G171800 [Arabis alpina]